MEYLLGVMHSARSNSLADGKDVEIMYPILKQFNQKKNLSVKDLVE